MIDYLISDWLLSGVWRVAEGHIGAQEFEERAQARLAEVFPEARWEAMAVSFNLVRAANRLVNDLEQNVYRAHGVSYAGYRILFALWVVGPTEPRELAVLANVTRSSASSVLNTLERDGLVARKRESADRRVVTVELTPAGQVVVTKTTSEHLARELEWTRIFTDRERVTLARLLGRLVRRHLD